MQVGLYNGPTDGDGDRERYTYSEPPIRVDSVSFQMSFLAVLYVGRPELNNHGILVAIGRFHFRKRSSLSLLDLTAAYPRQLNLRPPIDSVASFHDDVSRLHVNRLLTNTNVIIIILGRPLDRPRLLCQWQHVFPGSGVKTRISLASIFVS